MRDYAFLCYDIIALFCYSVVLLFDSPSSVLFHSSMVSTILVFYASRTLVFDSTVIPV